MHRSKKKFIYTGIIAGALLCALVVGVYAMRSTSEPFTKQLGAVVESTATNTPSIPSEDSALDTAMYSTTDPTSIWVIVNKTKPIAAEYAPNDLTLPAVQLQTGKTSQEMSVRRDAATELEKMFAAAKEQGVQLKLASGYRSYDLQEYYYNSLVRSLGAEEANKVSAKPGTSEHQTGLAVDIASYSNDVCHLETCFGTMPEGQWLANNAHTYGFIIRYPQSKTAVTGYNYEPWHVRYVGKELAAQLQKTGQTLEEFFSAQ